MYFTVVGSITVQDGSPKSWTFTYPQSCFKPTLFCISRKKRFKTWCM